MKCLSMHTFQFGKFEGAEGVRAGHEIKSVTGVDIYKVVTVAHGNQSNGHCNQSDTWLSVLLLGLY